MEPVGILKEIVDYLDKNGIGGETLVSFEDPEGDSESAEVRISWGGRDLFDLVINRI